MPFYILERTFDPPISFDDFSAAGKALAPCIQERDVKHLGSHFAADGTHSVCIYEAADAERIREANRVAGAPFVRVWQSLKFGG